MMLMQQTRTGTRLSLRHRRRFLYLIPAAALALPFCVNSYLQYVANLTLVYVAVAVGFNLVIGNLGQLAFVSAAFFGIGAYTTGILMYHLGAPFLLALAAAGITGAFAGALVSLPALRGIRGLYLALVTLAFGEIMRWIYIHAEGLTLGSTGLHVPLPTVFGYPLRDDFEKFFFLLGIVTLIVMGASNLLRSRVGRAFMAIKDNELAAASMGIPTARYILLAFSVSGGIVGIAGALYALVVRQVAPESFNLTELIFHFAIVTVGGLASIGGSVLGAIALTALPEFFREFPGFQEILFAALMILTLLFVPGGLIRVFARLVPALDDRYHRE